MTTYARAQADPSRCLQVNRCKWCLAGHGHHPARPGDQVYHNAPEHGDPECENYKSETGKRL